MREIKFRAWDFSGNEMLQWCNIDYLDTIGITSFIEMLTSARFKVMQFTGLKDKNGQDIYEGDIVKFEFYGYEDNWSGIVEYKPTLYYINTGLSRNPLLKGHKDNESYWIEVIGNKYENPELMEYIKKN